MEFVIDKEKALQLSFLLYCSCCMWFTSISTAIMIIPLVIFSYAWIFSQEPPFAVCMISKDKEKCIAVMEELAEGIGAERIIIYEEKQGDYEYLGDMFLQPEIQVDLDEDEED